MCIRKARFCLAPYLERGQGGSPRGEEIIKEPSHSQENELIKSLPRASHYVPRSFYTGSALTPGRKLREENTLNSILQERKLTPGEIMHLVIRKMVQPSLEPVTVRLLNWAH